MTIPQTLKISSALSFRWEPDGKLLEGEILLNQNPNTTTSQATVWLNQVDERNLLVSDGVSLRLDYDYQTNVSNNFWSRCCDMLREPFMQVLANSRGQLAEWHKRFIEHANQQLKQHTFDDELSGFARQRGMVGYHELVPGEASGKKQTTFTAGTMITHNNRRWLIFDMYCANPTCRCADTLLAFHLMEYEQETLKARECFAVNVSQKNEYNIQEIHNPQFTPHEADETLKAWFKSKPVWFTGEEMKSRSRQLKMVMARTWQKEERNASKFGFDTNADHGTHETGRNSPCPCGSGKKYKRCCGSK